MRYVLKSSVILSSPPLHDMAHGSQLNHQFHPYRGNKTLQLSFLRSFWIVLGPFPCRHSGTIMSHPKLLYLHSQKIAECTRRNLEGTMQMINNTSTLLWRSSRSSCYPNWWRQLSSFHCIGGKIIMDRLKWLPVSASSRKPQNANFKI